MENSPLQVSGSRAAKEGIRRAYGTEGVRRGYRVRAPISGYSPPAGGCFGGHELMGE